MGDHYSYKDFGKSRVASTYDQTRFGDAIGHWANELEMHLLESRCDFDGKSVLDVGSGTGRISVFLAQRGARVTGLDASPEMLNIFQQKIAKTELSIEIKQGDAHNIPFQERTFDYVVSFMTLMHAADWKKMLTEMCRVSSTRIILQFPSKCSFACLSPIAQPLRKPFNENIHTWRAFFISDIVRILEKNSFSVSWWEKGFVLPVVVHRHLKNLNVSKKIEHVFSKMKITSLLGSSVVLTANRKDSKTLT